ncbi:hypothetical protein [Kingella denitrificans]|nr:hypothetical protein [Kingella denitrificans]
MAAICRPTRRLICVKMRLFADSGSAAVRKQPAPVAAPSILKASHDHPLR